MNLFFFFNQQPKFHQLSSICGDVIIICVVLTATRNSHLKGSADSSAPLQINGGDGVSVCFEEVAKVKHFIQTKIIIKRSLRYFRYYCSLTNATF